MLLAGLLNGAELALPFCPLVGSGWECLFVLLWGWVVGGDGGVWGGGGVWDCWGRHWVAAVLFAWPSCTECTVVYSCVQLCMARGRQCGQTCFAWGVVFAFQLRSIVRGGSSGLIKRAQSGSKSGISPFRLPAQSGSKPEIWTLRLPPISRSAFRSAFRSAPSRGNFADFSGSLLRKSACSKKSAGGRIGRMAKTCQRKPPSTGRVCKRTCKTSQRRMAKTCQRKPPQQIGNWEPWKASNQKLENDSFKSG